MKIFRIYNKIRERWVRFHTRMVGWSLGSYGGGGRIESPVNFNNPHLVFVDQGVVIAAGAMFTCVTSWHGEEYAGEIHLGSRTQIREGVQISAATKLVIGADVGIARNCLIVDHAHNHERVDISLTQESGLTKPRPVVIEDGCFIGASSMICPGVRLGHHSVVGFGSMVTKSVPPYSVVTGSPARIISRYDLEAGRWVICRRKV